MKRSVLIIAAVVAVVAGLALGFLLEGKKEIKGYPGLGGEFTLTSNEGEVSLSDFRGKVVLIYFGYVSCPDACPLTMGKISAALSKMTPEQRDQVRVILVSIDPERDTPESLEKYTKFFGKEFLGVTGSAEDIDLVARNYRVLYERVDMPDSGLGYTIDHSSNTFIIDQAGVVRFIVGNGSNYVEYRDRILDVINDS